MALEIGAWSFRELNESPRSKLRGITELNFEDFSEAEANPVASYGEYSSLTRNSRRMLVGKAMSDHQQLKQLIISEER